MFKNLLRALVPTSARPFLRTVQAQIGMAGLVAVWLLIRRKCVAHSLGWESGKALILPGEPRSLVGSLGDEALLRSVIQTGASLAPPVRFHVIVTSSEAVKAAQGLGLVPVWIPGHLNYLPAVKNYLVTHGIGAVVALGADVVDGSYSVLYADKMLLTLDIGARMGLLSAVLGCSFTKRPSWFQHWIWSRLDDRIQFNLRDEVSLERFSAYTQRTGKLVADVAFLLEPSSPDSAAVDWTKAQRQAGRTILGFNLHPSLLNNLGIDEPEAFIRSLGAMLAEIAMIEQAAWLLIVHDRRGDNGDGVLLGPLSQDLDRQIGDRVHYLDGTGSSDSIKGLLGHLDGLVSGRMHLAIGGMGMGVPVLAIVYQGKFEGLYRHFRLPHDLLVDPIYLKDPQVIRKAILAFNGRRTEISEQIAVQLPIVRELASRNFYS